MYRRTAADALAVLSVRRI